MAKNFALVLLLICIVSTVTAQEQWPRKLQAKNGGSVTIYQPQPEKLEGNLITGRAAISVRQKSTDDPIFGTLWFTATIETNRDNRMAVLESIKINGIKLPGIEDTTKINKLRSYLESEI